MTLEDRFWMKVDKSAGPEDCWPWIGFRRPDGYGVVGRKGRFIKAHRMAWELTNGPIPEGAGYHGTCVMHRCDRPECVNPKHLELGSQSA